MKKIRNRSILLLLLLFLLWGFYAFLFDFIVPKTALLSIPRKWQMIPLNQSKEIVYNYLGEPNHQTNAKGSIHDEWKNGSKGKMYSLHMYYQDTLVVGYSIRYEYENWLFVKKYLLDSFSIR